MAKVQTPPVKVGNTPVKKNMSKKNHTQSSQNNTHISQNKNKKKNWSYSKNYRYCTLCRSRHLKCKAQEHVHSMLHHRELDRVLGKKSLHECQACKTSSMDLNEYAQHISTAEHQSKLASLMFTCKKPLALEKILSKETMEQILQRNKELKKEERKAISKKKKKQKQEAGQRHAEMLQRGSRMNAVMPSVQSSDGSANVRILRQETGRNDTVFQNKENKVSSLQRPLQQRESTLQSQSGRFAPTQPYVRDQFTQSAQQQPYDNFSVKIENSQTDRLVRRPHSTQGGGTNTPQTTWPPISHNNCYGNQYDKDFTSKYFPAHGAIDFDRDRNESAGSSRPRQEGSAQTASANGSANAAPIRDVDLRQIRRALGVREPCRADREARRQSTEAGAGAEKEQPAGGSFRNYGAKEARLHIPSAAAPSVQSSQISSPAPASCSGVCPPSIAPPTPKQVTLKMTQGTMRSCGETSLSRCSTASSKPRLNVTRKVRIAHKSASVQRGKKGVPKPTLDKLLVLSGAKNELSWRQMYEEVKRKKREREKGMPRFGIELANPQSDQESATQAEVKDATLSEGFHWESLPDSPSAAHWTELPPLPQYTIRNDFCTETQADSHIQEAPERPDAAQEGGSRPTVAAVSMKVETSVGENGDCGATSSASKRKHNARDGVSDKEPSGKKKKTKSNKDQDQMDQLLAVSLREDELSHSLQDLDKSLVQARNALQAAYAEVQRLLLLRQQFTAEVNSLRSQRIEILQGMQGGYTGASSAAEKATTSSAGAAATARLSPLLSSSLFPASTSQPSPSNTPASISPLALPTIPVKQETILPSTAGQAAPLAKTVSCNSDTLPVPANQPVPLFPSNILPSLLLPSPQLAAPAAAVASVKQLCSPSANTNNVPESSPPAQETGGNLCTEQVKKDPEKPVSKTGENASAAAPDDDGGGSESDTSVEMVETSDLVIIDIDESDSEDAPDVPERQEPPQKSVSVEFSSSNTPAVEQSDVDRKVPLALVPVKEDSVAPEGVGVAENEEPSVGAFWNHTGPVHSLQVHEGRLYTCSGDNTARAYSLMNRECLAVFEGHTNKVNCLLVSSLPKMPARLYTGSSDQTIRCYSIKTKKCLEQISLSDRVLCLHIAWNILYAGLATGAVASYDLKTLRQLDVFECHGPRGVSCLGTAQEGARRVLLVGSYDSTISVRDAKSGLLLRSLEGHTKTVLCMKVVNDLVFSGSSDTSVHAHNIHTGELIRIYKGHDHAVTSIVILGKVMVTACLDKLVRVYELQSHDRLQVYGGHSDMVMCMAVHKSVVYTGCYDGSVQAVKLNLMKNFRCWWQNCALIFGMAEHLVQHLVTDHSSPNMPAVKCRWRGCSTFFATQQSVRQKLPEHMQSHVEKDSKVQP